MSTQLKTLILKCPTCGAALDVTPEMEKFVCGYCGTEQIVQRQGGTVALKLIGDAILRVQASTDRTAAELAIPRIRSEVNALDAEVQKLLNARSNEVRPWMGVVAGIGCLITYKVALSAEWPDPKKWIFFAIFSFVIAAIAQAIPNPFKRRLKEFAQKRESLIVKLKQQMAIVDS